MKIKPEIDKGALKVSDTHMHFVYAKTLAETAEIFRSIMDHLSLESITLLALSRVDHRPLDPLANLKGVYLKSLFSDEGRRVYSYTSPFHFHDGRDTAEGYYNEAVRMYRMGADGYKILDGKPGYRRTLGRSLSDGIFDKMYGFIEESGMPLKIHMCDPQKFWGKREDMSEMAIKRGWWYGDGSYKSFDGIYSELEELMDKFPKIKLCIAHFGFITEDIGRCRRYLERWENLSFDLTPGAELFVPICKEHDRWVRFIEEYSDRIYFGTDTYNHISGDKPTPENLEATCERHRLVRRMLEGSPEDKFEYRALGTFVPLGLSDNALKRIYTENVYALHGEGRAVDYSVMLEEAERLRGEIKAGVYAMPEDEITLELDNISIIKRYCQEKIQAQKS